MEKSDIFYFIYRIKKNLLISKDIKINITNRNIKFYIKIPDISPEEICKLENLCFTKRTINSKKQESCDYERKEKN